MIKNPNTCTYYLNFNMTDQGSATTSDSSQPKKQESVPKNSAGPKMLARETIELKHYAFKDTNFNFSSGSVQSQNSSSGESGSWLSDRATPENSFAGAHSDGASPMGTPPQRPFLSNPPTGYYVGSTPTGSFMSTPVGTPPTGSYAGTPPAISPIGTPTGSYMSTPPAVSPIGTPTAGSYMSTPPAVSPIGTPTGSYLTTPPIVSQAGTPGGSYVGTPPSVSFLGLPSGSDTGASQNKV